MPLRGMEIGYRIFRHHLAVVGFAIRTRSRQEKAGAEQLRFRGVITLLAFVTEMHQWSDRREV